MKKILIIIGAFLIAVLLGAGGFWGGMTYQSNKTNQAQERFFRERGGQPLTGEQLPAGSFPGSDLAQGGFRGGGTMGEVKSVEGKILTLSTAQDVTTVNLTDATQIVKSVEGDVNDLQAGVRVMVMGERDEQGNLTASQITIINDDLSTIRMAP